MDYSQHGGGGAGAAQVFRDCIVPPRVPGAKPRATGISVWAAGFQPFVEPIVASIFLSLLFWNRIVYSDVWTLECVTSSLWLTLLGFKTLTPS